MALCKTALLASAFLLQFICPMCRTLEAFVHEKCRVQCSGQVLCNGIGNYHSCMSECFSGEGGVWMFRNETDTCEWFGHDLAALPACPAGTVHIMPFNFSEVVVQPRVLREYIVVVWTPCPFGLNDVQGYEVWLREKNIDQFQYCKQVYLNEKLTHDSLTNTSFSVLFENQGLRYGKEYEITIEGLPKTRHRSYYPATYIAKSCKAMNGPGNCECGLGSLEPAPFTRVKVVGYTVFVTIPILKPCFKVYMYKLVLARQKGKSRAAPAQVIDLRVQAPNSTYLNHTFHYVYPSGSPDEKVFVGYRAFAYGDHSFRSRSVILNISSWEPNTPTAVGRTTDVIVSWYCAPDYFHIMEYAVRLNWYGIHQRKNIYHQVNSSFAANCDVHGKMSAEIKSRDGIYDAQVRELRHNEPFSATWSVPSDTTMVPIQVRYTHANDGDLIAAASVLFPVTTIIISILVTVYCRRKGRCRKIRHRVPSQVTYSSDGKNFQHHCRTVWIVWQADTRTAKLGELHSENIRHLAAFLVNHCGLSVILDQYEVYSASSYAGWLREKRDEAEFVLFVYPHVVPASNGDVPSDMVGNFSAAFRLFENEFLTDDTSLRFATILLPYSDTSLSDASQFLLATTPTFKLMDEIESFYFFVQGLPKAGLFGRHVIEYISKHEYAETLEGLKLKSGMKAMEQLVANLGSESVESFQPTIHDDDAQDGEPTAVGGRDIKENCLAAVIQPPPITEEMLAQKASGWFKPLPPPPVAPEEDAEQSLLLINTQELLSLQPIESEPVEPIFSNIVSPLLFDSMPFYRSYHYGSQLNSSETCTTNVTLSSCD